MAKNKGRRVTTHKKKKSYGGGIPMVLKDTSSISKQMKSFWR